MHAPHTTRLNFRVLPPGAVNAAQTTRRRSSKKFSLKPNMASHSETPLRPQFTPASTPLIARDHAAAAQSFNSTFDDFLSQVDKAVTRTSSRDLLVVCVCVCVVSVSCALLCVHVGYVCVLAWRYPCWCDIFGPKKCCVCCDVLMHASRCAEQLENYL